jgi:uncharacterized protein (DUF58 family)
METQESEVSTLLIIPLMQFFAGVLLFIALLNRTWELVMLTLLVLGMARGAKLWSRMSLSGITWDVTVDKQRVFPGEKLTLNIHAENTKFLPIWLQMKVSVDSSFQPFTGDTAFTQESGLLWYQRVRFPWEFMAQRRGVHQVGLSHLRVGDLFGFFPREKPAKDRLHILVYPRLIPLKPFVLPKRDVWGAPGAKSPIHDPIYILGTRDYQHWQPAKYIHWKASARLNQLKEKVFEPSEQEKILLVVDVDQFARNNAEEHFERTLEVVASLAVRLHHQGCAVGLVTNGRVVEGGSRILPLASGPQQLPAILEVLAKLDMESTGNMAELFFCGINFPWGTSCVHFSYQHDGTTFATGEFFRRRKIPVVFLVCQSPPAQEESVGNIRGRTYHLDEICLQGAQRP